LEQQVDSQIKENKILEQILRNQDTQFVAQNLPIPKPYDYKYDDVYCASPAEGSISLASASFDETSSLQSWSGSQKSVCKHCQCEFIQTSPSPFQDKVGFPSIVTAEF
jgi:hypothetical protein